MKTIVWDIDDVLNDLTRIWLEKGWRPGHPGCLLRYENLTENPPHRLLGVEKADYLLALDRFRLSADAENMTPDSELIRWFRNCGNRFRHIALTARPRQTVSPAIAWVLRHFGEWFQTFSFVPAERPGEPPGHPDVRKADFLSWLGRADYFIDDSAANIDDAGKLGIQTFLVARPWNTSGMALPDILKLLAP